MADLTYHFEGNREDLLDIVVNITPTVTPILSSISHKSAQAVTHEWVTDELHEPADNKHVEGADTTFKQSTPRVRLRNYCQIFSNAFSVSETQDVVSKAGIKSEYAYQATKAVKEHARDQEYAILNNGTSGNAGDETTPRELKGIKAFIDSDNMVDGGAAVLTLDMLDDAIENAWHNGGDPGVIFCSAKAKRKITDLSGSTPQRTIPASEHKEIRRTDIYEGELGTVRIVPHRMITQTDATPANNYLYILELDRWRFDYLRRPKEEPLAKTGDSRKGRIVSEATLVGLAPKANSAVHNFKVA